MARFTYWIQDDMNALQEIAQAAEIMDDWFGSGANPVDANLSEHRASVCVKCPQNCGDNWWDKAKGFTAVLIAKTLELRKEMRLSTPYDDQLKVCGICKCVNKLKVHVPLKHIVDNLNAEDETKFRQLQCWITMEKDISHEL